MLQKPTSRSLDTVRAGDIMLVAIVQDRDPVEQLSPDLRLLIGLNDMQLTVGALLEPIHPASKRRQRIDGYLPVQI